MPQGWAQPRVGLVVGEQGLMLRGVSYRSKIGGAEIEVQDRSRARVGVRVNRIVS